MSRLVLAAALLALAAPAFAATGPAAPAPAPRPTTVGGGVRNPWTMPYTITRTAAPTLPPLSR
jgi:hypothetical protein